MDFFAYNERFALFGKEHLIVLGLILLGSVALPTWALRRLDDQGRVRVARALSWVISGWVLFWTLTRIALGDFDPRTDPPLDICNMMALTLPFFAHNPRRAVHEVLYFWILAGTIQAVLTPHLYDGFPAFTFFKYWFVHGGLVIYAVYATRALGFYPQPHALFRAFLAIQVYALVILGCNLVLGANYVYLLGKPPTASPLDYLGPWPWYLLAIEPLALAMFGLVYLPVAFTRRKTTLR